jgi:3-oxoadipate enol-lactonase
VPLLDRLLSRSYQEREPEKTFLFQQMGTFNHAKMANLKNHQGGGPTVEQVRASGVRICLLGGENDAMLRPETVELAHRLLPDSLMAVVAGAPHSMYWETPELFNRALASFLEEIYASSPVS